MNSGDTEIRYYLYSFKMETVFFLQKGKSFFPLERKVFFPFERKGQKGKVFPLEKECFSFRKEKFLLQNSFGVQCWLFHNFVFRLLKDWRSFTLSLSPLIKSNDYMNKLLLKIQLTQSSRRRRRGSCVAKCGSHVSTI